MSWFKVRNLQQSDIADAENVLRDAFAKHYNATDTASFWSDVSYVNTRWNMFSQSAFCAETNYGKLIGSNFAINWGSVGIFGPLTVDPQYWGNGVAAELMLPVLRCFKKWNCSHSGAMTFSNSPKHIWLYHKFGYYPRFLTAVMSKKVEQARLHDNDDACQLRWEKLSQYNNKEKKNLINHCRIITNSLYRRLDISAEILGTINDKTGDTVLLFNETKTSKPEKNQSMRSLVGFAVCHCGENTEAGKGNCYIKFGCVVRTKAKESFRQLVNACYEFAYHNSLSRLRGGVAMKRKRAYEILVRNGFIPDFFGVLVHKPNNDCYDKSAKTFVIDDWR